MWQTVFRLRDTNTARIFDAISALLVFFDGLMMSKGDAFLQQLFATNVAAAMCTVAHLRTTITPSHSFSARPSIVSLIRDQVSQSTPSPNVEATQWFVSSPNRTPKIALFRRYSYSEETLRRMSTPVTDYIRRNNALLGARSIRRMSLRRN